MSVYCFMRLRLKNEDTSRDLNAQLSTRAMTVKELLFFSVQKLS